MKKILMVALTLVMGLSLAACSNNAPTENKTTETTKTASTGTYRTLDQIKESGKIVIGVFSDKNPFGYVDQEGNYKGYDIYYAERLAKDLGVKVEYVSTEAANRVKYLETGKVDLILANFTVTPERAEVVDFALPYMKVALGIVSPEKALITDATQLNGKKLIVAKGTTADTYFTENQPDVELVKFDQYTEAYNALLDGRGDAFSTDNTEVMAWALQNPGFKVGVESLGEPATIAPAVSKGNDTLLQYVNEHIKGLAAENFFHKDAEETLRPVYGDSFDLESVVVEGGEIK